MNRIVLLAFLLVLGVWPHLVAGESSPNSRADGRSAQRAVERSIGYLQAESGRWLEGHKCAACHHVAMPLWALSEAGRRGYAIDQKRVAELAETLDGPEKMIAAGIADDPAAPPDPRPIGRGVNMGAVFMAVAAQSVPSLDERQKQSLRRIAEEVAGKQREDGAWDFFLCRPPINESQATDSAWAAMALRGAESLSAADSHRAALEKALAWLARPRPEDGAEVKVLKLLLAFRGGAPREKIQPAIDQLLASQRADGGWRQTAESGSDAFATGQTVYVLALAGYTIDRPEIRRAIKFLAVTQRPDGSWPMASRASSDGKTRAAKLLSPITCAATAWATLALARVAPER